jgi:Na+/H+-translocating membrane pyrophosphatase
MKHELLMLRSLLVASLVVCGLILGNMLAYTGNPIQLATVGTAAGAVTNGCALPPDGIVCPRVAS